MGGDGNRLEAKVTFVESLGGTTFAYCPYPGLEDPLTCQFEGRNGADRLRAGEGVDARRMAEHGGRGAGKPVDQPVFAIVVVHREDAVGTEVVVGLLDRLAREEIRLQPQLARPAHERERVREREEDEVVLPVGAREEGAPVVDVRRHARVGVRLIGVLLDADLLDARVRALLFPSPPLDPALLEEPA